MGDPVYILETPAWRFGRRKSRCNRSALEGIAQTSVVIGESVSVREILSTYNHDKMFP